MTVARPASVLQSSTVEEQPLVSVPETVHVPARSASDVSPDSVPHATVTPAGYTVGSVTQPSAA